MNRIKKLIRSQRSKILTEFASLFGRSGAFVERWPVLTVVAVLIVSLLLCLGAGGVHLETQGVYLWIPTTSSTYKNFQAYNDYFNGGAKSNFFSLLIESSDGGSILRPDTMQEGMKVHADFLSATDSDGDAFADHCFKTELGGVPSECKVENIFAVFAYDPLNIPSSEDGVLAMINSVNAVSPLTTLGGVEYDTNGTTILSATTMFISFNLKNPVGGKLHSYDEMLLKEFSFDHLEERYSLLKINRLSSAGFSQQVKQIVTDDIPLFIGAIMLIIVWQMFTFGKLTFSENRFLLSWITVPMVSLSLLVATGIQGMFGAKISTLNFLVGFALTGVGVDDMIVIEEFHRRTVASSNTDIMKKTMEQAGVAILITSITSITASLTGSFVDLPAVSSFCVCSGLAFAWNFVLSVTLFPACLVLDERRCGTGFSSRESKRKGDETSVDGRPETTVLDKIFSACITPFLAAPRVQIAIAFFGLALSATMAVYGNDITIGLDITSVVPDGSYVVEYFDLIKDRFGNPVQHAEICIEGVNFKDANEVANLMSLFDEVANVETVTGEVGGAFGHWYQHYSNYLLANSFDVYSDFGKNYIDFLNSGTCNGNSCVPYGMDVVGDVLAGELQSVVASKFAFTLISSYDTSEKFVEYNVLKGLLEDRRIGGFFSLEMFMYAENDSLMFKYLVTSLGVAIASIGVIMFIFTDTVSTIVIVLTVTCIDANLLGFARLWDIKLNSVMFLCMITSVGLSVDYCVHISHAFVHSHEKSSSARFKSAMGNLGPAVLKGGFTTLLGVCLLSQGSSKIFRIFFKMLFLTVTFGVGYGIVFLPSVLACKAMVYDTFPVGRDKLRAIREEGAVVTEKVENEVEKICSV